MDDDLMPTPRQIAILAQMLADHEPTNATAEALETDRATVLRWKHLKAVKLATLGVPVMCAQREIRVQ
jgi:DNA invertase Pin-like site-specific DNA recombinase